MKKLPAAGAIAGFLLLGGGIAPANAAASAPDPGAPDSGQTCPEGNSGKIEVADGVKTLNLQAPEGFTITEVCVKAGSAKQAVGGAEIVPYDASGVSHSSGKDISHYSFWYVPSEPECDYAPVS